MHTIHLLEFTGYEHKDIYSYLLTNNEADFRIIVEKLLIAPKDDNMDIAAEYYDAIYFGQKLAELSIDFTYNVPSEFSKSPFVYEFSTTDMEQLTDTMFYLIRGILIDEETTDIMDKYLDEKEIFWDQYCNNEIDPVCHGLIHIMEKMQTQ
jgi:hypothetical protein